MDPEKIRGDPFLQPEARFRRAVFHERILNEVIPMLKRWKVDVVTFGPSPHDADSDHLVRSYVSLDDRQQSQDTFYGSAEWRDGILAFIDNYTSIVLELDELAGGCLATGGHTRTRKARRKTQMKLQLIRSATLRIEYAGHRFIIDPYLAAKGSWPSYTGKSSNPFSIYPAHRKKPLPGSSGRSYRTCTRITSTRSHRNCYPGTPSFFASPGMDRKSIGHEAFAA